jgi:hypothetical protein
MTDRDVIREKFEENMRASPYEWGDYRLRRYPNDPRGFGWPDSYVYYDTELAWHIWEDAVKFGRSMT